MSYSASLIAYSLAAALLGPLSFGQDAPAPIPVRRLPAGATPLNTTPNTPVKTPANTPVKTPSSTPPASAQPKAKQPTPLPSQNGAAARSKPQTAPVPSQGTSAQDDRALEAVIRAKLARSKVGKDGFTVRVQGGVAFWEGQTGVTQHKGAATRMARTAGARQVVNHIRISDAARQQSADNLDQGRRRAQLKRSDPRSE